MKLTESQLRHIIKEAISSVLLEQDNINPNLETYYRGYNSKYGSQYTNILWITDDIRYAKAYGNRVEEIIIDTSKLHLASLYKIDNILGYEFDYYDGLNEDEAKEVIAQGYNAYGFEANSDNSYCICLLDTTPIVSRRELTRDEFDAIENYHGFDYKQYDDNYNE